MATEKKRLHLNKIDLDSSLDKGHSVSLFVDWNVSQSF